MLDQEPQPDTAFPWTTAVLVTINVAMYLVQLALGASFTPTPEQQIQGGGNLAVLTLTGDYWRLATSMFVHAGALHLALNMYLLVAVGRRAEQAFGPVRFLLVYLAGGVLASCASAWWLGTHTMGVNLLGLPAVRLVVSVGASGAIMAVCGALLARYVHADWIGAMGPSTEPGFGKVLLQVIAVNIVFGMFVSGVDQAAHIGGLLAGVLLAAGLGVPHPSAGAAVRTVRLLAPMLLVGIGFWGTLEAVDLPELQELRLALEQQGR